MAILCMQEIIELSGSLNETTGDVKPSAWAEGDICEAIWSNDGAYYKAKIDSIDGDGMCKVTFLEYGMCERTCTRCGFYFIVCEIYLSHISCIH